MGKNFILIELDEKLDGKLTINNGLFDVLDLYPNCEIIFETKICNITVEMKGGNSKSKIIKEPVLIETK